MTAATLRQAATLMRERAEAATLGLWRAVPEGMTPPHVNSRWLDEQGRRCSRVVAELHDGGVSTEHIASWRPAVALTVASWLEHVATFADSGNDIPAMRGRGFEQALAVARAYLGDNA